MGEIDHMKARMKLQKALLLLDRMRYAEAEECLVEAMTTAEEEQDMVSLGTAMCSLGELMHSQQRDTEAAPLLERVAGIVRDDDLLGYEIRRARELLDQIRL
jgi:hypothetical protein